MASKNIENIPMTLETRVAVLEANMLTINTTLQEMRQEQREFRYNTQVMLEKLDNKMDKLNDKIDNVVGQVQQEVRTNYTKVNDRLWSNFLWIMGTGVTYFTGSFMLIARAMHWF